jgi:hypothetical protein
MATFADYQVLFSGSKILDPSGINNLELDWTPPPHFVRGTSKARPVMTWQLLPQEISGYSIFLQSGTEVLPAHERVGVAPGQVHTASMTFHGPHLEVARKIVFVAKPPARFKMELVTIWFQCHIN